MGKLVQMYYSGGSDNNQPWLSYGGTKSSAKVSTQFMILEDYGPANWPAIRNCTGLVPCSYYGVGGVSSPKYYIEKSGNTVLFWFVNYDGDDDTSDFLIGALDTGGTPGEYNVELDPHYAAVKPFLTIEITAAFLAETDDYYSYYVQNELTAQDIHTITGPDSLLGPGRAFAFNMVNSGYDFSGTAEKYNISKTGTTLTVNFYPDGSTPNQVYSASHAGDDFFIYFYLSTSAPHDSGNYSYLVDPQLRINVTDDMLAGGDFSHDFWVGKVVNDQNLLSYISQTSANNGTDEYMWVYYQNDGDESVTLGIYLDDSCYIDGESFISLGLYTGGINATAPSTGSQSNAPDSADVTFSKPDKDNKLLVTLPNNGDYIAVAVNYKVPQSNYTHDLYRYPRINVEDV